MSAVSVLTAPQKIHRLHRFLLLVQAWIEVSRSRRQLLELDETQLKDIGVTRTQANVEGNKPFWRA